jgi:hypothetical protein
MVGMEMRHVLTTHLNDGEELLFYSLDDGGFQLRHSGCSGAWNLAGRYPMQYLDTGNKTVVWSGGKILYFSGQSCQVIDVNDFVGQIYCDDVFVVVGDTYVSKHALTDFEELDRYFHTEIISRSSPPVNSVLAFEDITGAHYSYSLGTGTVVEQNV